MNLLEKKRQQSKIKAPRRAQIKLDHMRNDINRTNSTTPSKNVSLMYCHNNDTNNVVIMEKDKKSVSIIPETRMNELRMGEKGASTTLNTINKKISMNQVKNVYSGYNKFWTYNGAIYGVKPGFIDRLDIGSTPVKTNISDVAGFSDLWYNTDIDVTNDRTHYEESGTDRKYKSIAANTSWYGTDTYQLGDNLMNRSDKLSSNNMLRYNKVRSTYVNIPVNNTASPIMYGDYVYKSRLEWRTGTRVKKEYIYVRAAWDEWSWISTKDMAVYKADENGNMIDVGRWLNEFNGDAEHSPVFFNMSSDTFGGYEMTRNATLSAYYPGFGYDGTSGPLNTGRFAKTTTETYSYQVTVYDPQYIPGIIAPNNFKWVDVAKYLYNNNKLVRGQNNGNGYKSYANIYNNTPYYAADVSESRRSTYHNGIRSLWNRSSSILFEKSYQVSDPPYPQPNLTFIGNLTNNKTHFNSLSAAKYA